MKSKSWGTTEGILVCCGIVAAGGLLQWLAGPVRWELMSRPVNGIVLAAMLACILLMHLLCGRVRVFRWMSSLQAGIPAIATCALLTILMGVTRQVPSEHIPTEPIGITAMLSFWPFVLAYVWLMLLVGMVCMTRLSHPAWRNVPFLLNHLGIFLALVAGTLGNADMQRLYMTVEEGKAERLAVDAKHRRHEMPITVELHDFSMVEKPTMSFLSDVTVQTRSGISVRDTIRVNKPLSVGGWKIYQYSYNEEKGNLSEYSVFELVYDPWLPLVYCGIFMMLAGAVCLFIKNKW